MSDEHWAYEKAELERHKHDLEVSRPETLRYQDALRGLIELAGSLFEHLDIAADIEVEREELRAERDRLKAHLAMCERVIAELKGKRGSDAAERT